MQASALITATNAVKAQCCRGNIKGSIYPQDGGGTLANENKRENNSRRQIILLCILQQRGTSNDYKVGYKEDRLLTLL